MRSIQSTKANLPKPKQGRSIEMMGAADLQDVLID